MTSDLDLQEKEEEVRNEEARRMAFEAALRVIDGDSRPAAVQSVKDEQLELGDASENELIRNDDGSVVHVNDTSDQQPPLSPDKMAQAKAIQKELLKEFW